MARHVKIGVLALQGAFAKHLEMLQTLDCPAMEVRRPEELDACDALIIPGGESTVIARQMKFSKIDAVIHEFGNKKPIFGTCAGLILLSNEVVCGSVAPLNFIDISVERNAFGRQVESFRTPVEVQLGKEKIHDFPAIFIRAPRIRVCKPEVKVLAAFEDEPILVQQGHHLGATFHPELSDNSAIHRYFISLVKQNNT